MSTTAVTTEVQFDNTDDLDSFTEEFFGQDKSEPTDTTDQVKVVEEEAQDAGNHDVGDAELKAEYVEPTTKKKTVQDRIDELVRQREDVKRDADQRLEAQRRDFEAKLAVATKNPDAEVKLIGEPTIEDRNQDGTDKYPLGEFDPKYIRDLTRYTLDYERKNLDSQYKAELQQRQVQDYRATLQTDWQGKLTTATQEHPDLIEKGQSLLSRFSNLDQGYSQYLTDTLMEMEHGPQVLYYLANNPDEATTIINSGAKKATLALGRIESRFEKQDNEPRTKVTKAPPPPAVRARGTNGAFISVAPDTDDLKAFEQEFFRR